MRLERVWARYEADAASSREASEQGSGFQLVDFDAALHAGELCAVLGPNGAGKSTLTRIIAGTLRPTRGRVRLFGQDTSQLDRAAVARQIAVVPQRSEVALGFTVREVVAMGRAPLQGAWLRATAEDERAIDHALRICELTHLGPRPVAELSGGEQKRVHIARALAQQAPILLLDEASAHLDVRHALALYELVRSEVCARNIACLAVMHDLHAAAAYADRVILLKDGHLVAEGSVTEVMTAIQLEDTFGVPIHVGTAGDDGPAAGRRYFLPAASERSRPEPAG